METVKQGNLHIIISDRELLPKEYEEITKWSDFNIGIPILFNFYHGLELLLKGFLLLNGYNFKPNHDVESLFAEFKKRHNAEQKIIEVLDKYLVINSMPEALADCLRKNNIGVNDFFVFLKYPTDNKFQDIFNYIDLKYRGKEGLVFFKELEADLGVLMIEAVRMHKEYNKVNGFY